MKHIFKSISDGNPISVDCTGGFCLEEHFAALRILSLLLLRFLVYIDDDIAENANWLKMMDEDFLLQVASAILTVLVSLCESSYQHGNTFENHIVFFNVLSCGLFWFSSILNYTITVIARHKSNESMILNSPISKLSEMVWVKVKFVWLHCLKRVMIILQNDASSKTCVMLCLAMLRSSATLNFTYKDLKKKLVEIDRENPIKSCDNEVEEICHFLIFLLDQAKVRQLIIQKSHAQ